MAKEVKKVKKDVPAAIEKLASHILVAPMVTEKSHALMSENKYVFEVSKVANKQQVIQAVKELYNVTAEKVNMVNIHPKKRVYGRTVGWKSGYKKAIVKLKEGDKIELFEGV
jgi:large subunit ribosomal protein L23